MSQPLQRRARVADVQPGAVAAQTHAPVELILVDDESTDDSVAVAVAVAQASGVPFKLLRQPTAGRPLPWLRSGSLGWRPARAVRLAGKPPLNS